MGLVASSPLDEDPLPGGEEDMASKTNDNGRTVTSYNKNGKPVSSNEVRYLCRFGGRG
jgi:hypothetical protein